MASSLVAIVLPSLGAAADAPPIQTAAAVPQVPIVARWDVIVSQDAIDAIRAIGKTAKSTSSPYQAYRCKADALRAAIIEAGSEATTPNLIGGSSFSRIDKDSAELDPLEIQIQPGNGERVDCRARRRHPSPS